MFRLPAPLCRLEENQRNVLKDEQKENGTEGRMLGVITTKRAFLCLFG